MNTRINLKSNKFSEAIDRWQKQPHSWQIEVIKIALENKRKSGEINPSKLARILKTKNK